MNQDTRIYQDNIYIQISKIGKAVSSPKRLEILDILIQGAKTVESIARETSMSVANTSQHLQTLLEVGLVIYKKQGLYSYYKLADKAVGVFLTSLQSLAEQRIAEIRRLRDEFYSGKEELEQIKMDELLQRLKDGNVTLIDVRPKEEYELLHIPGANSIPIEELEKHITEFAPGQEVVAYCRGRNCILSVEAVKLLSSYGFKAYRLEESPQEWFQLQDG
ncbi:MAG: transcriptional regulator, ArsR family [Neobacillus sp.]|jgi:ArsR family transcriptional regulator|nr:transcriptional regulator, ArsR family [Neobacillus sp.]